MNYNKNHNINYWNRTLNYFTVLLTFLTINAFGAVNISHAGTSTTNLSVTDSHSSLQTVNKAADCTHSHFHSPTEQIPVPGKQEDEDSKNNVEENEWNNSNASLNTFLRSSGISESSKQTIGQFLQALAKRRQLSLFILHCSWKSFLP